MEKLRLIVSWDCPRHCEGCCNDQLDKAALPVLDMPEIRKYDEVTLSGGEPLAPCVFPTTKRIIESLSVFQKVYINTAVSDVDLWHEIDGLLIDGVTLTLHDEGDVAGFLKLNNAMLDGKFSLFDMPLRLNVFDADLWYANLRLWDVRHKTWGVFCPVPEGETLAIYGGEK